MRTSPLATTWLVLSRRNLPRSNALRLHAARTLTKPERCKLASAANVEADNRARHQTVRQSLLRSTVVEVAKPAGSACGEPADEEGEGP